MQDREDKMVVKVEQDTTHAVSADELIESSDLQRDHVEEAEELAKRVRTEAPIKLLATGKKIIDSTRKLIAFKACRRYGKTFYCTRKIGNKIERMGKGTDIAPHTYHMFSNSQRQSVNAAAQLATHLRADEKALRGRGKKMGALTDCSRTKMRFTRADGTEVEYTKLQISIPGRGKGVALPASPDTCVGATGSVYLNEFGVVPRITQADMFSLMVPTIMSRPEYELVMESTPRGIGTKFHEVFTSEKYAQIFELFSVDIYQAIKEGGVYYDHNNDRVVDDAGIARLRDLVNDEDKWQYDFLANFVADVSALLNPEWISNCESLHDPDGREYEILDFSVPKNFEPGKIDLTKQLSLKGGKLFLGFDQARRKDLSEIWVDEEIEGRLWQRALITMKDLDFELQEQILWQFLNHPKLCKAGIDATGMGMRTAERAVTRFGSRVVAVNFGGSLKDRRGTTMPAKALIARTIRERHQGGLDKYPVMDKIRDDFLRVKRKAGASPDSFTYFADHDETGHADIFTAKALSDLVAQELAEYGGRVAGYLVGSDDAETRRSASGDWRERELARIAREDAHNLAAASGGEWGGIGSI